MPYNRGSRVSRIPMQGHVPGAKRCRNRALRRRYRDAVGNSFLESGQGTRRAFPGEIQRDLYLNNVPSVGCAKALEEWELIGCAIAVMKRYGDSAALHIAERIGYLALEGDLEGVATWRAIAQHFSALVSLRSLQ
jgi:hypothetical protein